MQAYRVQSLRSILSVAHATRIHERFLASSVFVWKRKVQAGGNSLVAAHSQGRGVVTVAAAQEQKARGDALLQEAHAKLAAGVLPFSLHDPPLREVGHSSTTFGDALPTSEIAGRMEPGRPQRALTRPNF